MGILDKISGWQMRFFLWVGLPLIAGIGIFAGGTDLVPAWKAKSGTGVVGTFTARDEDCGRRSCTMKGDWQPADGSAPRTDVILYDDPDSMVVGSSAEAIDSGARKGVFATAGGSTYLLVTGLTVAGAAAAVGWVVFLLRTFRRRKPAAAAQADDFFTPR